MEIHCGTEQKIVRFAQSLTEGFLSHLPLRETGRNVNLTTRPHPVQILRTSGVVSLLPLYILTLLIKLLYFWKCVNFSTASTDKCKRNGPPDPQHQYRTVARLPVVTNGDSSAWETRPVTADNNEWIVFQTARKNLLYVVMVIVRRERRLGEGKGEGTTCSIKDYSLSGGLQTVIVSSEENKISSPEYVCI
jgi:hypothetical protein